MLRRGLLRQARCLVQHQLQQHYELLQPVHAIRPGVQEEICHHPPEHASFLLGVPGVHFRTEVCRLVRAQGCVRCGGGRLVPGVHGAHGHAQPDGCVCRSVLFWPRYHRAVVRRVPAVDGGDAKQVVARRRRYCDGGRVDESGTVGPVPDSNI